MKKNKKSKVMKLYLLERNLYIKRIPVLPKIIRKIIRFIFSAEIPFTSNIHKSVELKHGGLGIVIHDRANIGENCILFHNVTIAGSDDGVPVIGKNVYIGTGAIILGNVSVGDDSKIGANAVVLKDVLPGTTVVGVPAKEVIVK